MIQFPFAMKLGDAFNQTCFVELVGNFVDDNGITPFAEFFDSRFTAQHQVTATGAVCLTNAFTPNDNATGSKIRTGDEFHQVFNTYFVDFIEAVNEHMECTDQFAQVVRRDIGCHTNGDTVGTVHQQGWDPGR